jgi:hypothetical protein
MTKLYIETKEGSFTHEGMSIPKAEGNRHYRAMLDEVASGKAKIQSFDKAAGLLEDKKASERSWRNSELARADIELNKVQDGEGNGLVSDWRKYRTELRDYPKTTNFPNGARPSIKFTG